MCRQLLLRFKQEDDQHLKKLSSIAMQPDPANKLSWSTAGSVEKNLPYLTEALSKVVTNHKSTSILELASGFGDHIIAYAREHPNISFQPTEYDEYLVGELHKKTEESGLFNLQSPRKLNILDSKDWQSLRTDTTTPFDLITITNLVNVAPWSVTEALFSEIGQAEHPILKHENGVLCLYAALKKAGAFQSEADEKFDAVLRARSTEFGLRDLDDIVRLAEAQGLQLTSEEALGGGTNLFLLFKFTTS